MNFYKLFSRNNGRLTMREEPLQSVFRLGIWMTRQWLTKVTTNWLMMHLLATLKVTLLKESAV